MKMKLTNEEIKNYENEMRKIIDERKYGFEDNVHKIANETGLIKNAIEKPVLFKKGRIGMPGEILSGAKTSSLNAE